MKWARRLQRRAFFRLLLQTLLCIALPAAVFAFIFFPANSVRRAEEALAAEAGYLQAAEKALQMRLRYMDELIISVSANWRVRDFLNRAQPLEYETMVTDLEYLYFVSELRLLHYSNEGIADVVVYSPDFAVSSMGLMRTEEYFRTITDGSWEDGRFIFENMLSLNPSASVKSVPTSLRTSSGRTLAYVRQHVDARGFSDSGIIIFWDGAYLDDVLSQEQPSPSRQLVFTDEQSRVLALTKGMGLARRQDGLLINTGEAGAGLLPTSLPGRLWLFTPPDGGGMEPGAAVGALWLLAAVLPLTAGIVSLIRFWPVRRLIREAAGLCPPSLPELPQSLPALADCAVGQIEQSLTGARERLALFHRMARSARLFGVLAGSSPDPLPGCPMAVSAASGVLDRLSGALPEDAICLRLPDRLLLLLPGGREDALQAMEQTVQDAGLEGAGLHMVAGSPAGDARGLRHAFHGVEEALTLHRLWELPAITGEEPSLSARPYRFPVEEQLALTGAAMSGDVKRLSGLMHTLLSERGAGGLPPVSHSLCLYRELWVCCLSLHSRRQGSGMTGGEEDRRAYPTLGSLSRLLCESAGQTPEQALFPRLLALVDEQAANPALSLAFLSEQLGLPPYQISRIFKREMLCGFQEYLSRRRIQLAKELLRDPSLGIKAIARLTGFSSAGTLIRCFRQYEGQTPGDYRAR